MIRVGGRTKLKCTYCMKHFLGGGIHCIKEHLTRHKGNASCFPKAPLEVQQAMQQSLNGSAVRKKRKVKTSDEICKLNPSDIALAAGELDPSNALQIVPINEMLYLSAVQMEVKEDGAAAGAKPGRKRRKKSCSDNQIGSCSNKPISIKSLNDKDQVYSAIGRFLYEAGVPLEATNSVFFQSMVDSIAAAGPGLELPSYHDLRGSILKKMVDEVNLSIEHYKVTWSRTGVLYWVMSGQQVIKL